MKNLTPEADVDRDIQELVAEKVRGTITPQNEAELLELQSVRSRMMRFRPANHRSVTGRLRRA